LAEGRPKSGIEVRVCEAVAPLARLLGMTAGRAVARHFENAGQFFPSLYQ
jgi:hypothetical protein